MAPPADEVQVHLLDAALGRAVKTWRFSGKQEISIGRLPECDVEINDLYVSRTHAVLRVHEGRWLLIARGRNGVVVENRQITELPLVSDLTFQLGSTGPMLRFCAATDEAEAAASDETDCGRTLSFDSEQMPVLALDESKLHADVAEIAHGDYFQKLQAQAKTLRARREL